MFQPLISIIIPTYNRAVITKRAVDSVIAQTYENWECIIVDDGSTDTTLDVLDSYHKKDSRIIYYQRKRAPKGAPTCRNIGLKQVKGDYVIYLDSDDYLLPICLEQRVKAFHENKDCEFLVFPMGKLKGKTIVKVEIPQSDDYLIPFLSANLPWSIMCPIWKASFLTKLNGFKEGYPRFNDPELMIRALLHSRVKFKVLNELHYDSVYIPSLKKPNVFIDKVHQSLTLFIPDIRRYLELHEKSELKEHLALYLHLWFKYIIAQSGSNSMLLSLKLINVFVNNGIITPAKSWNLKLRLFLFIITKIILKRPINKLTDRALYLK